MCHIVSQLFMSMVHCGDVYFYHHLPCGLDLVYLAHFFEVDTRFIFKFFYFDLGIRFGFLTGAPCNKTPVIESFVLYYNIFLESFAVHSLFLWMHIQLFLLLSSPFQAFYSLFHSVRLPTSSCIERFFFIFSRAVLLSLCVVDCWFHGSEFE